MPKYLMERNIPGAGSFTRQDLIGIAQKSCSVINDMGPRIQWIFSYVVGDAIYCTYIAPNETMLREHARRGGFPADRIMEIETIFDPTTAEA